MSFKIIDTHCHLHKPEWKIKSCSDFISNNYINNGDETAIIANMEEAGIEKTIIFPLPTKCIKLEIANHYVVSISRKYPDRFIPFTIIDDKPAYWIVNGVKGFKEHTFGLRIQKDGSGKDTFSQKFKETYRIMEHHRMPLLLHAGENRIQRIRQDLLEDTPDLIIILAHLGADFPQSNNHQPDPQQVKTTLNQLKNYPNLYFDISAICDPGILQDAVEIVGSKKLIFGSDFPEEKPSQTLHRFLSLKNLTREDLENIFYNNIINILEQQKNGKELT